jgi:hypothetical protein
MNNNRAGENRKGKYEESHTINKILQVWVKQATSVNAPINQGILLQKSNDHNNQHLFYVYLNAIGLIIHKIRFQFD